MGYQVICMAFDGEYKRQTPTFETIQQAWDYSDDLGSTWYFYPFHFVVSLGVVADAPYGLECFVGMFIEGLAECFSRASKKDEAQDMSVDEFIWFVTDEGRREGE